MKKERGRKRIEEDGRKRDREIRGWYRIEGERLREKRKRFLSIGCFLVLIGEEYRRGGQKGRWPR